MLFTSQTSSPGDTERTVVREATAARLGFNPSFPQATTAALFPKAVHDALDLDGLLTPAERATRDKVRAFMVGFESTFHVCLTRQRSATVYGER